ncbi:hypothetical protein VP01_3389g1 [Puccinia sorghi]|uniref:F-box domain-containing protein n=1 Tax=Puccinia sorghi TaxID=27349 RepID=A0A0L6UWN5_9BASI|nr:hypothetical protein VP01_3389g1 [Puccinia sorghi]
MVKAIRVAMRLLRVNVTGKELPKRFTVSTGNGAEVGVACDKVFEADLVGQCMDGGASGSLTNLPFRPGVHAGEPELADGPAKKRDGGQPELRANHGLSRIGWLLIHTLGIPRVVHPLDPHSMSAHTLLHDAVLRAANRQNLGDRSTALHPDNDDSVLTRVHSPLTSTPTQSPPSESPTPSNPSSPTKIKNGRNQSRVGLRQKREAAAKAKLNSRDPLLRLPIDVAVRIFTIVGLGSDGCGGHLDGSTFSAVKDLLNCTSVCQKWRTSSVINYVWFKLYHQTSYSQSIEEEFQPLTWTRKDSRTNWSDKYKELNQVKPSQPTMDVDVDAQDSGPTAKELREAQWNIQDNHVMSKNEARTFHKELGGRKGRDKTGKGWGSDRTGWNDHDIYD